VDRAVQVARKVADDRAISGQLAGAYWGESGIPTEWLEGLARKDLVEPSLEKLL
jgi:ADP-ribosylglycohydrolase